MIKSNPVTIQEAAAAVGVLEHEIKRLNNKLSLAIGALQLAVETLDIFQYSIERGKDALFLQNRLETARKVLAELGE